MHSNNEEIIKEGEETEKRTLGSVYVKFSSDILYLPCIQTYVFFVFTFVVLSYLPHCTS